MKVNDTTEVSSRKSRLVPGTTFSVFREKEQSVEQSLYPVLSECMKNSLNDSLCQVG